MTTVQGIIIFLAVSILLWIGYTIFSYRVNQKAKERMLQKIKAIYPVYQENKKTYVEVMQQTIELIFFRLNHNEQLSINSKSIWQVSTGSKHRLIQVNSYIKDQSTKIVLVYPSKNKILKYINENEIEFVRYNEKVHQLYVIMEKDLSLFLDEIKDLI